MESRRKSLYTLRLQNWMCFWFYKKFVLHWCILNIYVYIYIYIYNIIIIYKFYGNIFEKGTFENNLLGKAANQGSHTSDVNGNNTRYNTGQYSFTKVKATLSENKNCCVKNVFQKKHINVRL